MAVMLALALGKVQWIQLIMLYSMLKLNIVIIYAILF